jgi:hypothetical protein
MIKDKYFKIVFLSSMALLALIIGVMICVLIHNDNVRHLDCTDKGGEMVFVGNKTFYVLIGKVLMPIEEAQYKCEVK